MSAVVVLAGEPEYDSHRSMKPIADLIGQRLLLDVHYRTPTVIEDEPDFPESSFGDLSVLRAADLLIIYTRFRRLPDTEMAELQAFLERGAGVIGLRTSSHAFHFQPDSPWAGWNEGFGRDVLGSAWVQHHGHSSSTDVSKIHRLDHPILEGIPDRFHVRSWLYTNDLQPGFEPLLLGAPVDPETEPTPGPVAWTHDGDDRRAFYTSLGHQQDLVLPAVADLLVNAAAWTLNREPR